MTVTTSQFLDIVKRGVTVPASQVRFTDSDLLKFGDEETEAIIMPMVTSLRNEYYVKSQLIPLVAGRAPYKMPYRAIGRTLRNIWLVTTDNQLVKDIPYISPENAVRFTSISPGDPCGFTVQGDYVVMLPTPLNANYNIQMFYELAPSKLVDSASTGVVSAFDLTTGIVTLSATNSTFANGNLMDIVDGQSACMNKAEDITNSSVIGAAITFPVASLPYNLAIGDYVTLSNQTSVLQMPNETVQLLAQAVICRILEALGDFEGLSAATARMDKIYAAAQQLLNPRVEAKTPKVINSRGLLGQRPYNFRWRYNL